MLKMYNKIVRDRIPEMIRAGGQEALMAEKSREEIIAGLERKLGEELDEYLLDHSVEEMADILEVMHGILHHRGIPWEELERVREKKRAERGGFDGGIFLEAVRTDKETEGEEQG